MKIKLFYVSFFLFSFSFLSAKSLVVFSPNQIKKEDLKKDSVFSGYDISIFSNVKETLKFIKKDKPDVLIAPNLFFKKAKKYSPVLQFSKGGSTSTNYFCYSADKKWLNKNMKKAKVSIVATADRGTVKKFVKKITGSKIKKVKRVSKSEDLFSALSLGNADIMIIHPDSFESLKGKFQTNFFKVSTTSKVGNDVIGILDGGSNISSLVGMSAETLKLFQYDGLTQCGGDCK